jgi:hypothetical protein
MKQQFIVTHQYTILQETEKTWTSLNEPTSKHAILLWIYKEKQIFDTHFLQDVCL